MISRFASCRIAVLGDFFLDKYLDVDPSLEEPSVETGKPAHQVAAARCYPGAAGTVVSNLSALETGELYAIGFTGDDGEAFELRRGLAKLRCSTKHLHTTAERFTPTYLKPRDMMVSGLEGEHSRLDTKNRRLTPPEIERAVIDSLVAVIDHVDAIIVLDQVEARDCGAVTRAVRDRVTELALEHPDVFFWADSRRRIHEFKNVIIKPNEFEAVGIEDPRPGDTVDVDELRAAVSDLRRKTAAPLFITRGEDGMFVSDPAWTAVPGVRVTGETDTTGAGDSATAGCVLALCAGASFAEAAVIGNLVASITVEQLATTGTARPNDLVSRLKLWQQQNGG
ncbi:MAG: carbohydrate kinase [Planctomycetaceae bacterium]|nr:carbohydrate kinase [Planctomycetaceae bacterium]